MSDPHPIMQRDIRAGKPKLRLIAPLTWSLCWILVIIDFVVAASLGFIYAPATPIAVVSHTYGYQFWAVIFAMIGLSGVVTLKTNNWKYSRKLLFFGLLVKLFWLYALIIRTFLTPKTTILVTALWLCFTLVSAATFIWFLPAVGRPGDRNNG